MEKIKHYLLEKYQPLAIILYGSYQNHTNNQDSDYDALVITDDLTYHDTNCIEGIQLDVFVYSKDQLKNLNDFIQIYFGEVIYDTHQIGQKLLNQVHDHIDHYPKKTIDELNDEVVWCQKMLKRIQRKDTEGMYRYHLLCIESLEIYFDCLGLYYFGPKKSILYLQEHDQMAYQLYTQALDHTCGMKKWIQHIESTILNENF